MKSKISQATKKSVSLLLAILMMFSMLTVAMTVTVNAAGDEGTVIYVSGTYDDNRTPTSITVWTGSADVVSNLTDSGLKYQGYTVYKATNVASGNYTHLNFDSGSRRGDIINGTSSSNYDGQLYLSSGSSGSWISNPVWDSTTTEYTVTVGSTTGGTVELVSTSPAAANTEFEFKVKANDGYQIGTVTLSNGTTPTKGSVDSNGYTHYTFTMPPANVTINATFTSTETPSATYFIGVYNSSDESKCVFIPMDPTSNNTYVGTTANDSWVNGYGKKFKITTKGEQKTDLDNYCVQNVSLTTSDSIASDKFTLDNGDCAIDSQVVTDNNGIFVIEYDPTANSVKLWTKTDYDAAHGTTPTADITIKPTSLKNMGVSEVAPITATHSATCAGDLTWTVSEGEGVISIAVDSVKDPLTCKVTALQPGTAKVKITCSETSESVECPVEVKRLPFAETGRIYAYAGRTAPTDTTLVSDAWIAAEKADNQLSIYGDNSSSAEKDAVKNYPTLGSATEKDLCIYLPSSAATDKVTLYNASEGDLVVGSTTITKGNYGEVSYTDGTSQNITLNGASKTLTIYRSNATGALYLNNSGSYVGNENGVPKMITQLYSGKDTGELGKNTGNYGAYTDNSGTVKFAGVSKVKGRGNSTWKYTDKKSFNVTFTDAFKAFGFDQGGKKYSLLANFKDPSLSRNKILYQLGKDVFGVKYVPKTATVDLYMNGLYMGSYLMTQKIELGSKEVVNDVDGATLFEELYTDPANQTSDIQSKGFSFLMELDSNAGDGSSTTDPDYYTTATDGKKLTIKEPEYGFSGDKGYNESVDNAIKAFVKSKYNQLKEALNNTSITYEELNAIVDVDSLTRYFLLNEFAKNYDIGVSSTYFVYKCELDAEGNVTGGKFYASPVWDMDVTASNCEKENNNYSSYEGDWSNNNNNDWNVIMKAAFGNPVIQNAADAIWTPAFYTTLTNNIKTLATNAKNDLAGSYENNFRKWTYPYDFNGQGDNVQPHTSLDGGLATFNVSNADYTKTPSYDGNSYSETAREGGQIDFLEDWLLSRAAWMTHKYNETITPPVQSDWRIEYWDKTAEAHKYIVPTLVADDGTATWETNFDFGSFATDGKFRITNGETWTNESESTFCVPAYKRANQKGTDTYVTVTAVGAGVVTDSNDFSGNDAGGSYGVSKYNDIKLTGIDTTKTYVVTYTPGTVNVLDGQITIADKSTINVTKPTVSITGTTLTNENIVLGTPITITATVAPLKENDVVVAGDYTVTLYRGNSVVKTDKINFTAEDTQKEYTFNTELNSNNESYTVKVTKDTYSATSSPVEYKQTGVKDIKIYFDPSEIWLSELNISSTVTATAGEKTFTMSIDPGDDNALAKGVFRAMIDSDTLAAIKTNGVSFRLDDSTEAAITATADASANVSDGDIYTLDKDNGNMWCSYNKTVNPAYPGGCKTYEEFVAYLKQQVENSKDSDTTNDDNIVYFDNSASKWYNVYIYCWDGNGNFEYAAPLQKLPYANIWYYNFGTTNRTTRFLFKDRSEKAYGIDYQQTVDLVGHKDKFVYNANGEQVYLNFENTINTPNPIFITANFYKCTTTGANGYDGSDKNSTLKYRAFNTEWKEFSAVIAAEVKTKAVTVYFDLHRNNNVDDVQLYHSTKKGETYKFASTYTRLTPLPGSNIYSATIQLPYKVVDGSVTPVFTFDKFIIGKEETVYPMSSAVQPKADCFTTGEVWYEYNGTKPTGTTPTNLKSKVYTSANAKTPLAETGANVSTVSTGAGTALQWIIVPQYLLGTWTIQDAIQKGYVIDSEVGSVTIDTSTNKTANYFAVVAKISDTTYYNYKVSSGKTVDADTAYQLNENATYLTSSSQANHSDAQIELKNASMTYKTFTITKSGSDYQLTVSQSNTPPSVSTPSITSFTVNGSDSAVITLSGGSATATLNCVVSNAGGKTTTYAITNAAGDVVADTVAKIDGTTFTAYKAGTYTVTASVDGAEPKTVTITVNASAITHSVTLDKTLLLLDLNGTTSATLIATPTGFTQNATVTWHSENEAVATVDNGVVTAVGVGTTTIIVTYQEDGNTKTATCTVTVTDSSVPTVDYCGILGYNHSTATFESTTGGKIDSVNVILNGGYNTDGAYETGYATTTDGVTTVIYAIPTEKDGATTVYKSTTSSTGDTSYLFNEWTKDGAFLTSTKDLTTDKVTTTDTVKYVANWSKVEKVQYTFTYKYWDQDKSKGMEYNPENLIEKEYVVTVMLDKNASDDVIKAAFRANAPKLSSDYYNYSFDSVDVAVSGTAASATAAKTVKEYSVTITDNDGKLTTLNTKYNYQNLVTLTAQGTPATGYRFVWKYTNTENVIGYGNSISIRITDNLSVEYEEVPIDPASSDYTILHKPTYEFFTSSNVEKVRFNFLVENTVVDKDNFAEFGILYFFTDEKGVNSNVYADANVPADTLKDIVLGKTKLADVKVKKIERFNFKNEYIFNAAMTNSDANLEKYVRVYSYIKFKDGRVVLSDTTTPVLGSLKEARLA